VAAAAHGLERDVGDQVGRRPALGQPHRQRHEQLQRMTAAGRLGEDARPEQLVLDLSREL
jgi:hypothetical protein